MARLNEPPAAVESLESLKRRFVRQNRDLARCNSAQSIKIRALETDLSHQLSENASLRTRILSLENELADARAFDVRQSLSPLRSKLRSQFDGILADLTELEKRPRRRKSQIPTSAASPRRSPQRREWRNTSTLSEVLASQGGTMPTISEGKYFPRRTSENADIRQLVESDDSPDMAPPRTHLDHDDQHVRPLSVEPTVEQMSAVEIRRRRRDSRVHERSDDENSEHPIKAGAKRKLSFSEVKAEERAQTSPRKILGEKPINNDPVVSPQKSVKAVVDATKPAAMKPIRPSTRDISRAPPRPESRVSAAPATRPRSAEPRPATKPTVMKTSAKSSEAKSNELKAAAPSATSRAPEQTPQPVKLEPKTPNPLDMLSPPSTEPSATAPLDGRPGTPPPLSIPATNTSADPNGVAAAAGGRGSLRRNRAAVSYAEPKLNVKMRRPAEKLADAVMKKDGRESDASGIKIEEHDRSASAAPDTAAESACAAPDDKADGAAPGSPLADKNQRVRAAAVAPSGPGADRTGMDIFEVEGTPPAHAPAPAPSLARASSRAAALAVDKDKSLPVLPADAHSTATRATRRQTVGAGALSDKEGDGDGSAPMREVRVRARRIGSVGVLREGVSGAGDGAVGEDPPGRSSRSVSDLRGERADRIAERRRSMVL